MHRTHYEAFDKYGCNPDLFVFSIEEYPFLASTHQIFPQDIRDNEPVLRSHHDRLRARPQCARFRKRDFSDPEQSGAGS